jgi:DNA-binding transcriptional ArsR family regulator
MSDYYADEAHVARVRAKDFVAALEPKTQALWQRMPWGWTPMMELVGDEPQSTVSARLGVLRRAHFAEVRQEGRTRFYRPVPVVRFLKEVRRRPRGKQEARHD